VTGQPPRVRSGFAFFLNEPSDRPRAHAQISAALLQLPRAPAIAKTDKYEKYF
jgi:hypothetical protein